MYRLPDLRPLVWLAVVGLVCIVALAIGIAGWLGFHLWAAFTLYLS